MPIISKFTQTVELEIGRLANQSTIDLLDERRAAKWLLNKVEDELAARGALL